MITLKDKDSIIETPEFKIYENTLIYKKSVIQLDNISQMSVSQREKYLSSPWMSVALIVGIFLICLGQIMGWLCLIGTIIYFIYMADKNKNRGYYLKLELNSGRILYFSSRKEEFLEEVLSILAKCINDSQQGYVINMGQAEIHNLQVGDNNTQM